MVPSLDGHAPHAIVGLSTGECKCAPGFAQGYIVELGFLLYGHGEPASKNHLPPLILGIPELEIFTGLGFHVALVYSSFGVYGGVYGHQMLPLIPLGLVKTLGKGLRIRCLCIMVLALWCSVASACLENGDDPNDL